MEYVKDEDWINVIVVDDRVIDIDQLVMDYVEIAKDCKTEDDFENLLGMFFQDCYYIAARDILLNSIQQQIQSLKALEEEYAEERE